MPVDPQAMYPVISSILARTQGEVKLGGMIREPKQFRSEESSTYSWEYESKDPRLHQLYMRAKEAQWKSEDLPWNASVDLESRIFDMDPMWEQAPWFLKLAKKEQTRVRLGFNVNQISQFVHGEQGALVAASQLIGACPGMDSKYYAASQTFDEARHVEVFSRYANEKLDTLFPITQNLFNLLQAITIESRWDFKSLGMQLIVEGLAITAFINMYQRCHEPLLKELLKLVLRDEARHVAFGVLALRHLYDDMDEKARRERQEFIYEACVLMRGRLISSEAYEMMGVDPQQARETMHQAHEAGQFTNVLFSQIVPQIKKIGLLEGWLEERFAEMQVLQFKDYDSDAVLHSLIAGDSPQPLQAEQQGAS